MGVGVKQHGGPSVQADPTQPGVRHILGLQLPQPVHMGRAQVDLLLFLRLPLLHQEDLVGILDGQEIIVPQAAVLPANGVDDASVVSWRRKLSRQPGLAR